ncbi:MAG TPA: hypothetical protein VJN69_04255 [Candidatus Acidoferrales bacterium]|nr:hypothetical protein [Candidatus Acidoferrales bacterium]
MQDTRDNYFSAFVSIKNNVPTMLDTAKPMADIITGALEDRIFG